jgi:hypothetical protein
MMWKNSMFAVLAGALVSSCVVYTEIPPYQGPVAPRQVAYRIDDHRYFEIVPKENNACFPARLHYVDTALGIRTNVTSWNMIVNHDVFIVDAASKYLVTPLIDPKCETGGGNACMPFIRYSTDAGLTWRITRPGRSSSAVDNVYLIGDTIYYGGQQSKVSDLSSDYSAWVRTGWVELPPAGKPPIDSIVKCDKSKTVKIHE